MKKIGIVGGISWPNTLEYYLQICIKHQRADTTSKLKKMAYLPDIVIEHFKVNLDSESLCLQETESKKIWAKHFETAVERLRIHGAKLIVLASAVPHACLEELTRKINVRFLSIYECIAHHCAVHNIKNILVLGTKPTMGSPVFIQAMKKLGINAFYPPSPELRHIVSDIIETIYPSNIDSAASVIDEVARSSFGDQSLRETAVCLSCTELSIAFGLEGRSAYFETQGIKYFNSSAIHIHYAFEACIEEEDRRVYSGA